MVGHHDVDSLLAGAPDPFVGEHAAVDRQNQSGSRFAGRRESGRAEIVPVLQAMGHERDDPGSERGQDSREEGRAADSVDVVVAVDQDSLTRADRPEDPIKRPGCVRKQGGGVEVAEQRAEEIANALRTLEPSPHEQGEEGGIEL